MAGRISHGIGGVHARVSRWGGRRCPDKTPPIHPPFHSSLAGVLYYCRSAGLKQTKKEDLVTSSWCEGGGHTFNPSETRTEAAAKCVRERIHAIAACITPNTVDTKSWEGKKKKTQAAQNMAYNSEIFTQDFAVDDGCHPSTARSLLYCCRTA